MQVGVAPGRYVIAVSGGVDSMVLLNILQQQPGVKLTVAHFDHGIREDSVEDRRLVQTAAEFYRLPFVYHEGNLGTGASEAAAREARYDFLYRVRQASGAQAIITAHHQDDALETAILNMLRGTGPRGLGVLTNRHDIVRPLMITAKPEILRYAQTRDLAYREDPTNHDQNYLRNYIRWQIMPRLDIDARQELWQRIRQAQQHNREIDDIVHGSLHLQTEAKRLDRQWFNHLPHKVAREIMAGWLRAHGLRDFDRRALERLVVAAKIGAVGSAYDVFQGVQLRIGRDTLALVSPER